MEKVIGDKGHATGRTPETVMIVVNTFGRGGAEMSLAVLAGELARSGRKVNYIALWKGQNSYDFGWLKKCDVRLQVINETRNLPLCLFRFFRTMLRERPSIIYSSMLYANFISQLCSMLFRTPHIASVRSNPTHYYSNSMFKRWIFFLTMVIQEDIIFISRKALKDYLATPYGQLLGRKRFHVLHNPIEGADKIDDLYLVKKFEFVRRKIMKLTTDDCKDGLSDPIIRLVIVSRLVAGKGIMETLKQVRKSLKDRHLQLSIYGEGPLKDHIREYIDDESLGESISIEGFCSDLDKIFSQSDITIFPSRNEGFGRVPFEALMRGNLVLCYEDVSIMNEFLQKSMVWHDYREPLDLPACIEAFASIDPLACVREVKEISHALSPAAHVIEFEKIATAACTKC